MMLAQPPGEGVWTVPEGNGEPRKVKEERPMANFACRSFGVTEDHPTC